MLSWAFPGPPWAIRRRAGVTMRRMLHITDLDKIDLTVLEAIIAESYRTVTADMYTRRAREGAS